MGRAQGAGTGTTRNLVHTADGRTIEIKDFAFGGIDPHIYVCCNPRCLSMFDWWTPDEDWKPCATCGWPVIATKDPVLITHARRINAIFDAHGAKHDSRGAKDDRGHIPDPTGAGMGTRASEVPDDGGGQ